MPLRLEIKKQFSARSERVKCVDFHPREPWILSALYSGHIFIWNHQTQTLVKSVEVCDLPVRSAKFITRKQWIICGSDDMQIRVYNYNTMERIKAFEAHSDYIRSLAVHPTLPYVLSSSDDMFIKLWDWDKGWECLQVFDGHTHYVMQVEFNPKDTNTFASGSLDRTVKVWGLNSNTPHFSLKGHDRGVNCISYFRGGDRPYLVSGGDDHLVKIWDYQTKSCVTTLEGHSNNVSAVAFHPQLPIIISGAEDGTVRIWHSNTYRLENTLNYGMERVWTIACLKGSNKVALGYDDGTVMIKLGHEEPVMSMERAGKVVYAKNQTIVQANIKKVDFKEATDGDKLQVQSKELGACEVFPQSLQHNPNGRLLCACGDGEYIIYTALSLKNKSFGTALEFVWSNDSGVYATRESTSKIKIFKNFKEHKQFRPNFAAEGIFGGALLGIRSADFLDFYDWNECKIIRRIDACPRKVYWSEGGELVVLACDTTYYVLRYNRPLVQKYLDQAIEVGEQGIENAFEPEKDVAEKVRTGYFVGDCFIYTNSAGRLNYYVGGEVMTLSHLSKPMYILGYMPKENRVYLMDKQHNMYSYSLLVSVLVYQTAIVRKDFDGAAKALNLIPKDHYNRLARFLEAQDLKELALQVSNDPEHRFELAMQLKKLTLAREILMESESEQKWKQLGDLALNDSFDLKLAEECYGRAHDLGGLLLLYTSLADRRGMERLANMAREGGRNNIAFLCYFLLNRVEECVGILCETNRIPEAAFLARTYLPSAIPRVLALWKEDLRKISTKAAESLADPNEFPDSFPDLDQGIKIERWLEHEREKILPASAYNEIKDNLLRDLIQEVKEGTLVIPNLPPKVKPGKSEIKVDSNQSQTNASSSISSASTLLSASSSTSTLLPASTASQPLPSSTPPSHISSLPSSVKPPSSLSAPSSTTVATTSTTTKTTSPPTQTKSQPQNVQSQLSGARIPSNAPPSNAPPSNAPPSNAPPSNAPPSNAPPSNAPPPNASSNAPPSPSPSPPVSIVPSPSSSSKSSGLGSVSSSASASTSSVSTLSPPSSSGSIKTQTPTKPSSIAPSSAPIGSTSSSKTQTPLQHQTQSKKSDNITPSSSVPASVTTGKKADEKEKEKKTEMKEEKKEQKRMIQFQHTPSNLADDDLDNDDIDYLDETPSSTSASSASSSSSATTSSTDVPSFEELNSSLKEIEQGDWGDEF